MPNREDYNQIEANLNKKPFLQPVNAKNTKANIYYVKQKWIKYAPKTWILVI